MLDSGSTDSTLKIAKECGAQVHQQTWLGFGPQKNKAADLASHDWILCLDADEALSEGARTSLSALCLQNPQSDLAFSFPRMTFHLGRGLRYGGNYPDRQTRFYNKSVARWSADPVHEKLIAPAKRKLSGDILHWSFRNVEHQIATINKYSTLRAQAWAKKGKRASLAKILFKPWAKFIQNYFFKLGFLDGFAGFQVAVVGAFSYFLRLVKLRELQKSPQIIRRGKV